MTQIPIRRALVSVYDKTGLDDLVRGLHDAGVALVSTGGSAARSGSGDPSRSLPRGDDRAGASAQWTDPGATPSNGRGACAAMRPPGRCWCRAP